MSTQVHTVYVGNDHHRDLSKLILSLFFEGLHLMFMHIRMYPCSRICFDSISSEMEGGQMCPSQVDTMYGGATSV